MVETLPLIIHKEEQLVFPDRAAKRAAKHVPTQSRPGQEIPWPVELVLPLVGIEFVVTEELPDVSMETVGARLDRGVDDTALEIAELCGSVGRDYVEFFNSIGG